MKIDELMVGDWVSYCGFYNKVIYIGQKVSMYDGKGTEFTTDPEYIRPIPITDEILEKNGFTKTWNGDWQLKEYATIIISKDYYVKVFERSIRIDYVHELQHLLRLCGVEKELTI